MSGRLVIEGFDMFVGETRKQGFTLSRSDGQSVTPTNATYKRYKDGAAVDTNPVAAVIDGDDIYADIPATTTPGAYIALFTYTEGTQTVKTKVSYNVFSIK